MPSLYINNEKSCFMKISLGLLFKGKKENLCFPVAFCCRKKKYHKLESDIHQMALNRCKGISCS